MQLRLLLEHRDELRLRARPIGALHRLGRRLELGRDLGAIFVVLVDRVVIGARLRIGQDLVGLAHPLELLGMGLRRILAYQREVRLLDRALVGGAIDPEGLVEVVRRVCHRSSFHPTNALATASATVSTKMISTFDATSAGSSRASLMLRRGISTVRNPAKRAATIFSWMPPTGFTSP